MKSITTDAQIRAARTSKSSEDYKCGDSLYCRVFRSGKKTFRRIQKIGSSTVQITIGAYPDLSLSQAKNYNSYIKELAKKGHSQSQIKNALNVTKTPVEFHAYLSASSSPSAPIIKTSGMNFIELSHRWFENKKKNKKWKEGGKHIQGNWNKLENHVFPHIGQRPVAEISRSEVIDLLQHNNKWWEQHPQMVKVKRQIVEIFELSRSTRYCIRADNPADFNPEIEGMNVNHKEQAQGFMAAEKVPEFVAMLDLDNIHQAAVYWLILQAKRPENIVETEWSEINFERRIWEIPANKIKTGAHHMSWVSDQGLLMLRRLKGKTGQSKWVLPYDTKFGHIDYNALNRTIRRILGERRQEFTDARSMRLVTAHGFRHTFKTWTKEQVGDDFRDELSEAQEARKKRGISAIYDHSYQVEARIPMMTKWDQFVSSLI
ncbi:integrase arm-type DNA-binding domain-containing protein [Alphaproteobacteria bacterium]|nr:integrase arm-type DNA-binding domain-containing protein [Alphaproteobacteria bacterium]